MSCLICHGPADDVPSTGDWDQYRCSKCGEYKVTRSFVASMDGQVFDVERTRAWLRSLEEGVLPTIGSYDCGLLRDP